ncbi:MULTISPECIES: hypothetical protein [Streptomyces]|uniref:AG1 protein n=1 Tax=Streptomyces albidocamelliae TaxID=2981135 RepID=A0ABY6ESA1_9ACTN|nr:MULTISPECIES: hypothetical protein [unclassified Streptomyces]OKJ86427.1 hypothetical protein AMK32_03800 [Streptomyces sp. CB01883]UXY37269.1 hypothetical protein N8I86_22615 [Streptomyces sp. HUAS 14-6]
MAWEEWEQLKAQAADRHSTRMQLNQYPADQGGGSTQGDLVVGHKDLEQVGHAAHDLFGHFTTYSGHARVASEAAAGGLKGEGFALGGALEHVTERWSEQTKSLLDACAHISNHLRYTKNQHAADDSYIAGAVSSIATLDKGFDDRKGH